MIDLKRTRTLRKLSQETFAAKLGVSVETLRNWEQGKREPRGPSKALIKLVVASPDWAFRVLGEP